MLAWLKKHWRRLLTIAMVLAGIGIFAWLVLGFRIDFFPKDRLERARQKWASAGITSYRMTVIDRDAADDSIAAFFSVTVRHGEVVEIQARYYEKGKPYWRIISSHDILGSEYVSCMKGYTVEKLFDRVECRLEGIPAVDIRFCEDHKKRVVFESNAELGYLESFSYDWGGIWLGVCFYDSLNGFLIEDFEPLSDT